MENLSLPVPVVVPVAEQVPVFVAVLVNVRVFNSDVIGSAGSDPRGGVQIYVCYFYPS